MSSSLSLKEQAAALKDLNSKLDEEKRSIEIRAAEALRRQEAKLAGFSVSAANAAASAAYLDGNDADDDADNNNNKN